jgi:hypothetical protein
MNPQLTSFLSKNWMFYQEKTIDNRKESEDRAKDNKKVEAIDKCTYFLVNFPHYYIDYFYIKDYFDNKYVDTTEKDNLFLRPKDNLTTTYLVLGLSDKKNKLLLIDLI